MPLSLYDAVIPSCLQVLHGVRGLLDKAESWCAEEGIAESEIVNATLADDMLPFSFQIASVANHSLGAIKGVREGVFSPNPKPVLPTSLAEMKALVDGAIEGLNQVSAEEMEGLIGADMLFSLPVYQLEMPFTAENYLLSFAQPNFYFHATTAYDILRAKGLPIGKQDFLGPVRIKAN